MDISDKCIVLSQCWIGTQEYTQWDNVRNYGNVAFPLALSYAWSYAKLTPTGEALIEDLWVQVCASLHIDDEDNYESFSDMLDAHYREKNNAF